MDTPAPYRTEPAAYQFEAPAPTLDPADANAKDPTSRRRFSGVAYSGDVIPDHWAWGNLVIDLASIVLLDPCPVLLNHERDIPVGVGALAVAANALMVAGTLLSNASAQVLAQNADEGFPWQLSVHADPGSVEEIAPGTQVQLNGRTFFGPLTIFRQSRIRELSFTPTGYDHRTRADVLSRPPPLINEAPTMAAPETNPALVAELTAQVTTLTARAEAAETALATERTASRTREVETLFSSLGRPCPEKLMPHYLALPAEAFADFAADLRAASKPAAPSHLFSEQAVGDPNPPNPAAKALDFSAIYEARRSAAK
ncbi:hypothetical protein [uncultured Lamprocystis sp.]|jgi:hypothetical protein|uniref:hypothetical protein n=1 Tax=uncultured Lamprocystis sp. TaxID=543132 RepID=UPI002600B5D9|nr:hypothetical protein [uncultured Lamprocystis sp.]